MLSSLAAFAGAIAALNFKSAPFAYHIRGLYEIGQAFLRTHKEAATPTLLFKSHSASFRLWPDDMDYNLHMNNASYLKYADYGRASLAVQLKMARCVSQGINFICAGSSLRFEKSIKPFQSFTVTTKILAYDGKFLDLLQHYHAPRTEVNPTTYALILSRFVFRRNKKTIPPCEAFRIAGFVDAPESLEPGRRDLPEDVLKRDEELYKRICVSTSPLSL